MYLRYLSIRGLPLVLSLLSLLDSHMTGMAPREWMRQERGQSEPYTLFTAADSGTPVNNRKVIGVSVSYSASRII